MVAYLDIYHRIFFRLELSYRDIRYNYLKKYKIFTNSQKYLVIVYNTCNLVCNNIFWQDSTDFWVVQVRQKLEFEAFISPQICW